MSSQLCDHSVSHEGICIDSSDNPSSRTNSPGGTVPFTERNRPRITTQLLESTRMILDSITYAVGYEDGNSFRRLLRQRVGLLPAAYRKMCQSVA